MPILVFAVALGGAALLHYLAERGARLEDTGVSAQDDHSADRPTLRQDPQTGEWHL